MAPVVIRFTLLFFYYRISTGKHIIEIDLDLLLQ
jgi:hypothetical protein